MTAKPGDRLPRRDIVMRRRTAALALASLLLAGAAQGADPASAGNDWRDLYRDARPVFDLRYRYEHVDQDGRPEDANANTVRSRIGFETGRFHGFGLGLDVEWIEAVGDEKFNDTINGRTRFPVVADPDDEAINQLFLVADGTIPKSRLKLGRQRIIWDDARFIGNVGFRQNEQTFDALRAGTDLIRDVTFDYAYLEEAHRIFGRDSAVGRQEMQTHAARARYSGLEFLTITPFALLLDFERRSQAGNSSASYGARLAGAYPLDKDWTLRYAGSAVYQEDHGSNPASFNLWYYAIEPGLRYRWATISAGYEVLEGDGANAFQTPLATLHKFNGLTDQFLVTPPDGLEDLYLKLSLKLPGDGLLSDLVIAGAVHDFQAEDRGTDYGSEWNLGLFKTIGTPAGKLRLGIQYASYDADDFASDIDKLWLTVQFQIAPAPLRSYLPKQ